MANGKIVVNQKIRHGKPIIRGTRIIADEVLGALAGGITYEEVEKEYGLKKEDIVATIDYATPFLNF